MKAEENKNNVYSAGHNIYDLPESQLDRLSFSDAIDVLLREVQSLPCPVIAVVRGSVWVVAFDLVMTCDMVFADKTLSFATTPAKIGILYNLTGNMQFIHGDGGLNPRKEMFFTAIPVGAETCDNCETINRLFGNDELDDKVLEIAKQICQNSPLADYVEGIRSFKAKGNPGYLGEGGPLKKGYRL